MYLDGNFDTLTLTSRMRKEINPSVGYILLLAVSSTQKRGKVYNTIPKYLMLFLNI